VGLDDAAAGVVIELDEALFPDGADEIGIHGVGV
jgi:hypothetical protein